MSQITGFAQTVLGQVPANNLGVTMPHEHLLIYNPSFIEPKEASQRQLAHAPVTLENLGWIRQNWTSNLDNLKLYDEDLAFQEVQRFRNSGGNTIVDPTVRDIGRDPAALARISRASGLHIVMGSGYYVSGTHPIDMDSRTVDDIAQEIIHDIEKGVDDSGIRAGLVGEIGCSWPLRENERKVLRGAGYAQLETGAALMVHPGRNEGSPAEIIQVLKEVGTDLSRTIIAHMDRTVLDLAKLREIADSGCYLEYDVFGLETSYYPFRSPGIDMPSDAQRLDQIARLIKAGYGSQLLISQDICTKHRLVRYGGHGYDHILLNIIPWMRRRGFAEEQIIALVVINPQKIIRFA